MRELNNFEKKAIHDYEKEEFGIKHRRKIYKTYPRRSGVWQRPETDRLEQFRMDNPMKSESNIELTKEGFVFIEKVTNQPFLCCLFKGEPWVFRWHPDNKWVTIKKVEQSEINYFFTMAISKEKAQIYHDLHDRTLTGKEV